MTLSLKKVFLNAGPIGYIEIMVLTLVTSDILTGDAWPSVYT